MVPQASKRAHPEEVALLEALDLIAHTGTMNAAGSGEEEEVALEVVEAVVVVVAGDLDIPPTT